MAIDFRANQIQTNKIIPSGSSGTNAKLLIYSASADATPFNQGNIDPTKFVTSSIGTDVFLYVSGSPTNRTVFGGDVYHSGNLIVSESNTITTTKIVFDNPSVAGNVAAPTFTGVGIGLGGFDPGSAYSGSIYIPNVANVWVPIIRHESDYQYNTTTLTFGVSTFTLNMNGNEMNIQAAQAMNFGVGSGYSMRFAAFTGDSIVFGARDNGSLAPFDPQYPTLRMPNYAGGIGTNDINGVDMVFQSGLGTGAGIGSSFRFLCPEPIDTGDVQQTAQEKFRLSGEGYLRIFGSGSALKPDASGGAIPGALWHSNDIGKLEFVSGSTWVELVTSAQTGSFVTTQQTGSFVTTSQTGSFVLTTQTGSFVTTSQTSSFVTLAMTGSLNSTFYSFDTEAGIVTGSAAGLTASCGGTLQLFISGGNTSINGGSTFDPPYATISLKDTLGRYLTRGRATVRMASDVTGPSDSYQMKYMLESAGNTERLEFKMYIFGGTLRMEIGTAAAGSWAVAGSFPGTYNFGSIPTTGTVWLEYEWSDEWVIMRYGIGADAATPPTTWTERARVGLTISSVPTKWDTLRLCSEVPGPTTSLTYEWDDLTITRL